MIEYVRDILQYSPDNPLTFVDVRFWVLFTVFLPVFAVVRHRRMLSAVYVVVFSLLISYETSGLFCLALLGRGVVDYFLSRLMSVTIRWGVRRLLLTVSVVSSVGVLFFFKFPEQIVSVITALCDGRITLSGIVLPVGISFYTFQSIGYMVDVYKGRTEAAANLIDYVFFLSFFPILAAGPILRASQFFAQLCEQRAVTDRVVSEGLWLVMCGLVKKAVVADYLGTFNAVVFENPAAYSGVECLLALVGYSVQIYFDFSGYSDIAIGLGRILGFDLGVNFRSPFKATDIRSFWRRWHISLSSWLRDYVYIPLGGSRCGEWRTGANIMVTMLIGGLWHGSGWNFLIWGGLHGLALVVWRKFGKSLAQTGKTVGCIVTFLTVTFLWAFFRTSEPATACRLLSNVFLDFRLDMIAPFVANRLLWTVLLVVSLAGIFMHDAVYEKLAVFYVRSRWIVKFAVMLAVMQTVLELSDRVAVPFIYMQF